MCGIDYCQGEVLKCRKHRTADSVAEGWSHDEISGGRSVTGVHQSIGHLTKIHLHGSLEENDWTWKCNGGLVYKLGLA